MNKSQASATNVKFTGKLLLKICFEYHKNAKFSQIGETIDPMSFDCIPPVFEEPKEKGWKLLAKLVMHNQSCEDTLNKYIKHARKIIRLEICVFMAMKNI